MNEYIANLKNFSRNAKLFLIGGIFSGIGMSVFQLLFNLYLKDCGKTETEIGFILSAGSLGATIVAIPAALMIERLHIKHILLISTIFSAISYGLQVYFADISLILFFSFMASMFITIYRISSAPFFMRNSSQTERIYLFSISAAIMMGSALIGFMIGGFLPKIIQSTFIEVTKTQSYQYALYIAIAASLLSLIPFVAIREDRPVPDKKTIFVRLRHYNWNLVSKLIIPKLFVGMGAGLIIPFMNLYFRNVFTLESPRIGTFFSILQVFMFVGMFSAPLLSKRLGMLRSIVITELVSIPFMFILALTSNLTIAVVAFIFRGTLMNMNTPIGSNFEMELVKRDEQALTNALSMLAWNGAWTISAHFGGAIIEKYSFQYSFYITIALYFCSAISYYIFFRNVDESKFTFKQFMSK